MMWEINHDVLNGTHYGLLLFRLLNRHAGEPARCNFPRRHWNGHNVVYRRRCWVRLQRWEDWWTIDSRSGRLDSNLLIEVILVSRRQLYQYYLGSYFLLLAIWPKYYHAGDIPLISMCHRRFLHRTTTKTRQSSFTDFNLPGFRLVFILWSTIFWITNPSVGALFFSSLFPALLSLCAFSFS